MPLVEALNTESSLLMHRMSDYVTHESRNKVDHDFLLGLRRGNQYYVESSGKAWTILTQRQMPTDLAIMNVSSDWRCDASDESCMLAARSEIKFTKQQEWESAVHEYTGLKRRILRKAVDKMLRGHDFPETHDSWVEDPGILKYIYYLSPNGTKSSMDRWFENEDLFITFDDQSGEVAYTWNKKTKQIGSQVKRRDDLFSSPHEMTVILNF